MESEFYITLPSNSSMSFYPDNKTGNYTTKLPRTIELSGEWEVGMSDIKYPHTWYNVREGKNTIEVFHGPLQLRKEITIRPGYYDTVGKLLKRLWDGGADGGLKDWKDITLKHDKVSKRVEAQCKNRNETLVLRDDIARICGFKSPTTIMSHLTASYTLALPDTGNQYFYVYTDIIEGQYYGDVVAKILQTVTVKGEHGSYVNKHYERPNYLPLSLNNFDTISINIRDEAGDLVAFEYGKVNITLHFRRRKTSYYI